MEPTLLPFTIIAFTFLPCMKYWLVSDPTSLAVKSLNEFLGRLANGSK
jgi:hypothetical protein